MSESGLISSATQLNIYIKQLFLYLSAILVSSPEKILKCLKNRVYGKQTREDEMGKNLPRLKTRATLKNLMVIEGTDSGDKR